MWASPDMAGVPGGSSEGPPNGDPKSVKFNVVKLLFSTFANKVHVTGILIGSRLEDHWLDGTNEENHEKKYFFCPLVDLQVGFEGTLSTIALFQVW